MDAVDAVTRVESPCVRNCCLDDADVCLGCHRTLDEIIAWSGASDAERREILAAVTARAGSRRRPWNVAGPSR